MGIQWIPMKAAISWSWKYAGKFGWSFAKKHGGMDHLTKWDVHSSVPTLGYHCANSYKVDTIATISHGMIWRVPPHTLYNTVCTCTHTKYALPGSPEIIVVIWHSKCRYWRMLDEPNCANRHVYLEYLGGKLWWTTLTRHSWQGSWWFMIFDDVLMLVNRSMSMTRSKPTGS